MYRTTDWAADIGHLSHANAAPGIASTQQYVCGGNARREQLPRNNEVICFMLDGSLEVLVVAPVMTDLNASGGIDDYHKQPKGNLDVTGQYFIWTTNVGGSRLDAFIVKVPTHLLTTQTARPDLVVTALSNPPAAALPGSSFSVTDTVKNQAAAAAGASTTRYYLAFDQQKGALLTGSRSVPSLAPGASIAGAPVTLTIPSTTALGTYQLLACADDTAVVAETDETNNCRASLIRIVVIR